MTDGSNKGAGFRSDREELASRVPAPQTDYASYFERGPGRLFQCGGCRDFCFGISFLLLNATNDADEPKHSKQRGGEQQAVDHKAIEIAPVQHWRWLEYTSREAGVFDGRARNG